MKPWTTLLTLAFMSPLLIFSQSRIEKVKSAAYDRSALFSSSWNLAELYGTSVLRPDIKPAFITITPGAPTRITGYTGCNLLSGTITLEGQDGMKFYPTTTTKNNCMGSSVEGHLVAALVDADGWDVKNGQLYMYQKNKVIAKWNPSNYQNNLLYGIWQLNDINDRTAPFSEMYPVTNRPSIVFMRGKNTVTGSSGCNEFSCPVLINQATMSFAEADLDTMKCDGPGEKVFLEKMKAINGYKFQDDNTLLLVSDNTPVMLFTRFTR